MGRGRRPTKARRRREKICSGGVFSWKHSTWFLGNINQLMERGARGGSNLWKEKYSAKCNTAQTEETLGLLTLRK